MTAPELGGFLAELAGWAAASGREPQRHRYGDGPEQVADLLLPGGHGPHRVAVLLHGGFWRARFTRSLMSALAVDLATRGWATWNIEFRRAGNGGGVPGTLDDVRAAIAGLGAVEAPVHRDRLVLVGHSAGGQLALCMAGLPEVTAVVSLAGVCDLVAADREGLGEGAAAQFVGATSAERPDVYALADPMALLPSGVEVLLAHGDADERVPVEQSRRYARAAGTAGDRCELLELPGVDHFALIDPRSDAWAAVAARLEPPEPSVTKSRTLS